MTVVRTAAVREVVYPEHVDPVISPHELAGMRRCGSRAFAVHCSPLGLTQLEVNQEDGPFGARLYTEMRRQSCLANPYAELVSRVSQMSAVCGRDSEMMMI